MQGQPSRQAHNVLTAYATDNAQYWGAGGGHTSECVCVLGMASADVASEKNRPRIDAFFRGK